MNDFTLSNYKKLISAIIENLPHRDQMILSLHYVEGLSIKEIARVLQATEEGIKDDLVKAVNSCISSSHIPAIK